MNSELYSSNSDRMGHRILDIVRELVDENRRAQKGLLHAKDLVHDENLKHTFVECTVQRASFASELLHFLPELGGAATSDDSQPGKTGGKVGRLWTEIVNIVSRDGDAVLLSHLIKADERSLSLYDEALARAKDPTLLGMLGRQRNVVQGWSKHLEQLERVG